MAQASIHSLRSSHREALLEHLFAGDVMKRLWLAGLGPPEVRKPQMDDAGYDLVLEANSKPILMVRHIQLKSSFRAVLSAWHELQEKQFDEILRLSRLYYREAKRYRTAKAYLATWSVVWR